MPGYRKDPSAFLSDLKGTTGRPFGNNLLQIAPHLLDQRRLLIQKIIDRLQQRLKPRVPLSADHS